MCNFNDNRLENLCLLCPNCHRQTENYAGKSVNTNKPIKIKDNIIKNPTLRIKKERKLKPSELNPNWRNSPQPKRRKAIRPETKEELLSLISQHGYKGTGNLFGVSDNAVRKWLKYY